MATQDNQPRWMPCDIRCFSNIRTEGYVYLDKTEQVYRLTHSGMKYVYMSRPRRFGKSMLLDTLDCYYSGRSELFRGLRIAELMGDEPWPERPVIRLDMSMCTVSLAECLEYLNSRFSAYEKQFGVPKGGSLQPAPRFARIIKAAAKKARPVVLIDEYDAPLVEQYVLQKNGKPNQLREFTKLYSSVFNNLKALEGCLDLVMMVGCTRFNEAQINNIQNISLDPEWATLCGFTRAEMAATYGPELDVIAAKRGESREATLTMLCKRYDGYLFSYGQGIERVYNPFSMVNALRDLSKPMNSGQLLESYWTGTAGGYALQAWAPEFAGLLKTLDKCYIDNQELTCDDITSGNPLLLFYQAGYLTIDHSVGDYVRLRFPNGEISRSLFEQLLPTLFGAEDRDYDLALRELRDGLQSGDVEKGLWGAHRLIARALSGNETLTDDVPEQVCPMLFSLLCYALAFRVSCEPKQSYGFPDRVVEAGNYIYVIEFKRPVKGGIAGAWRQVRDRRYVEPYIGEATEWGQSMTIVALAILVRDDGKALIDWQAKSYATREGKLLVGKVRKSAPRWKELEKEV